jgi:hypothetical protein
VRVAFFAPSLGNEFSFYDVFVDVLRSAAATLDVELDVVDCQRSTERMLERGRTLVRSPRQVDYVLLPNYMGAGVELLPALDAAAVRAFVVPEGLSGGERAVLGEPRGRLQSWLGEILPDDAEAGYRLARALVEERVAPGRPTRVAILSGDQSSAGLARFRGWARLKAERSDVEQASFQYAGWERDKARRAASLMLRSQPEIDVIWAANDAMAMGALEAAREVGRRPGEDVLVGGIDLGYEALRCVAEGSLTVSVGGHFLDGARALVLLHDHYHGRDFEPLSRRSPLVSATSENAARHLRCVEGRCWRQVDFTRFSAARHDRPESPDFSLASLVAALPA